MAIDNKDTDPVRVRDILAGRTLMVTGATGFVGKVALSMLLDRYPEVGKVYVLVRPGLSGTAEDRFYGKVLASPAFDPLRAVHGDGLEAWMRTKVVPVPGDVTDENLGLPDEVVEEMRGNVDVVLNSAGMVDFTPPLESSIKVNADGGLYAARLCHAIGAGLVHVSTCFTAGAREGHIFEDEHFVGYYPKHPDLGTDFDPEAEIADCRRTIAELKARADDRATRAELRKLARERLEAEGRDPDDAQQLKVAIARERKIWLAKQQIEAGMQRAQTWGWQNTYCYTKALGDQRVAAYGTEHGMRFALAKPAVVESALRFPFPGWNEGFTTCAPLMYLALRGHRTYPSGEGAILDVIPVDLVCSGLIAITALTCENRQEKVYQLCTGDSNPLPMDRVIELTALTRRQHFKKRETGSRLANEILSRIEPLPKSKRVYDRVSAPAARRASQGLRRFLDKVEPTWGAPGTQDAVSRMRSALDWFDQNNAEREMLFDLFMPFLWEARYVYRADRMARLMARMDRDDQRRIPWDPEAIQWRDYWLGTHIEGLKKWVFPNIEEDLAERGKRREKPPRDLVEMLRTSVRRHKRSWALRQVVDGREARYTYEDLDRYSDRAAAWLALRDGVDAGDRVVVCSENRPEWPMAVFGVLKAGAVLVPVDSGSAAEEVANVAAASGAKVLILSDDVREDLGDDLLAALEAKGVTPAIRDLGESIFGSLPEGMGPPKVRIKGDSLASLIFTSGTTGEPKGVMLSHRNFCSLVTKLAEVFALRPTDGVLSVLPLHHTFEYTCGLLTPLSQGAEVTYLTELSGDALSEALRGGRITAMVGVPALWQILHRRIEEGLDARGPWARELSKALMAVSRDVREKTGINLGRALFAPVHKKFGGVQFLVSGGSALSPDVMETFQGLGFDMFEGYGLTEAAPVLTVTRPGDGSKPGSVGKALPGIEIRISEPDEEGVGEVLARGPNVMAGYYGDEAATGATIRDGWLHTGDLGRLDEAGRLYIVGRQKDVIVDAGGKNVYPDEIESLYEEHRYVDELCVVGLKDEDGRGERVACLVVPDYEAGADDGLSREEVREAVRAHFREVGSKLPLYRRVKVLHLRDVKLVRTATRKVKRPLVVQELERLERAAKAASAAPLPRSGRDGAGQWVLEIVAAVAQRPASSVKPDQRLVEDLGLDSLGLTEIAAALEGAGIVLPDGVENELKEATVARLAEVVATARRTARPASAKAAGEGKSGQTDLPVPRLVSDVGFRILRAGQKALYERFLDVKVSGTEHVPTQGAFIVASNHTSHLDMGLVKHALGPQGERMSALAARDYFFDKPLKRAYFGHFTNLLPMEREGSIRESLRLAAQALRRGKHLLIFPEGTRSLDGELMPFLPSVGYLALTNQVDVLPMYLAGTHDAMPKGRAKIERRPLRVAVGPLLRFADYGPLVEGMPRSLAYRAVTALVEDAVHALHDARPRRSAAEVVEAVRLGDADSKVEAGPAGRGAEDARSADDADETAARSAS